MHYCWGATLLSLKLAVLSFTISRILGFGINLKKKVKITSAGKRLVNPDLTENISDLSEIRKI